MLGTTVGTMPQRIAVIGAGISGMGAAHALAPAHHVTLFEAEPRIGGHARTRMAGPDRDQPVDTGFIVYNLVNYPNLKALFAELGVETVPSSMSFGVSSRGGRLEYGLAGLATLFAQRRNIADPRFLRMVRDILRFNARALSASEEAGLTIGGLLEKLRLGSWFRDHYLLPLSGAIWSTPKDRILDFPAHAMVTFFRNHGLLHHAGQHQWYTVKGGSQQYVTKLEAALRQGGVDIRTGAPVAHVRRDAAGVEVRAQGGLPERFDAVIFATHSDDTLSLLADPSPEESRMLGAVRYQPNDIILHSDISVMPRRRSVWSSWVYVETGERAVDRIELTYWMNSLQPWLTRDPFFVTLNTDKPIREDLIWDRVTLRHPVYDLAALAAQKQAAAMNGTNRTWFCGAWMRNGFHEDGLTTGIEAARGLLSRLPQAVAAE